MENLVTPVVENQETPTPVTPVPVAPVTPVPKVPESFSWKNRLMPDYANSPTIQLFPDTVEGFNDAVKSHLGLVRLVGNEKVPIPKGKDDVLAREVFNKALGVPDSPEGYALADVEIPESMKGLTFDKQAFAKTIHSQHLTPDQAKGLWENYTAMSKQTYDKALKEHQARITETTNALRQEWGDAYKSKVDLGQMVINKFSGLDKEMNDFITASLVSDPRGIKFLASIGDQFAENKIGDFKYQRHSLTPDEAQAEIDSIRRDPSHAYNNEKMSKAERDRAIDFVNSLLQVAKKPNG